MKTVLRDDVFVITSESVKSGYYFKASGTRIIFPTFEACLDITKKDAEVEPVYLLNFSVRNYLNLFVLEV